MIEVISVSRPEFNHVFMERKKDWWSWFAPKWSHEWRKKNGAQLAKMFESEIAYEVAKCFTYPFNEYVHSMTLSQPEQTRFLDNYSRLNKFDLEKEAKLNFKLMDVDPRYTYYNMFRVRNNIDTNSFSFYDKKKKRKSSSKNRSRSSYVLAVFHNFSSDEVSPLQAIIDVGESTPIVSKCALDE